jgi:hypothetical protein
MRADIAIHFAQQLIVSHRELFAGSQNAIALRTHEAVLMVDEMSCSDDHIGPAEWLVASRAFGREHPAMKMYRIPVPQILQGLIFDVSCARHTDGSVVYVNRHVRKKYTYARLYLLCNEATITRRVAMETVIE